MQTLPLRQEFECSRIKDLRAAAQPRKPQRHLIRRALRRH
jgi:hypothetical protein